MTPLPDKAIRRRNTLLLCAAVSILAALLMGFWPWSLIASSGKLLSFLLIVGGGCFAALAAREFAGLLYDPKEKPWYAQPGGILFLMLMLSFVNGLCLLAFRLVPQVASIRPICVSPAFWLAVIASELLWIVLLDWVPSPVQERDRSQPDRADITDRQGPDTSPLPPHEPSGTPRSGSKPRADAGERRKPAKKTRNRIDS